MVRFDPIESAHNQVRSASEEAYYEDNVYPYHVRSRNRQDEPQGVFSHATALSLHELSDVMPATLHMTVPPGFRRMAAIPEVLRLHRARLADREVQTVDGVRVTVNTARCHRRRRHCPGAAGPSR
jgi:predicted transcriptional regulator of viral defense system